MQCLHAWQGDGAGMERSHTHAQGFVSGPEKT